MAQNSDSDSLETTTPTASRSALALYREALRNRPLGAGLGLVVEYAMFAAALFLAVSLFLTRVPLGILDRALGLRLRERFVNLLARISPG